MFAYLHYIIIADKKCVFRENFYLSSAPTEENGDRNKNSNKKEKFAEFQP